MTKGYSQCFACGDKELGGQLLVHPLQTNKYTTHFGYIINNLAQSTKRAILNLLFIEMPNKLFSHFLIGLVFHRPNRRMI